MKDILIMTPGPTGINEDVLKETAVNRTNPDLDNDFFEVYRNTVEKFNKIIGSRSSSYILSGEGILGLEAACATLTEAGDKVLCITNGIFGDGFADFIKMYGGDVTIYKGDYKSAIDVEKLESFLLSNSDFKYATLVHCETPSGITNPIQKICPLLAKFNILSVVDSVSAMGGESVQFDDWEIDILLGGSQKCISFIPGLTFVTVSDKAWASVENRKSPVAGFYCNLSIWRNWYEKKHFPYTQPTQLIYGLNKAIDKVLEGDFEEIHQSFGEKTRKAIVESGLELYADSGFSNTVTTVLLPDGLSYKSLFDSLKNDNIMVGGGFGFLDNMIFRIGHMGANNSDEKLLTLMESLDDTFSKLGIKLNSSLKDNYKKQL